VQVVGWVPNLNTLSLVALFGLLLGVILAKQPRLPRLLAHFLALLLSGLSALWLTCATDYAGSLLGFFSHVNLWTKLVLTGGVSTDESIFLFFILTLGFLLAYTSAWLVYRTRSPWLMLLANAVVLLLNPWAALPLVGAYPLALNLASKADLVNTSLHTVLLPCAPTIGERATTAAHLRPATHRGGVIGLGPAVVPPLAAGPGPAPPQGATPRLGSILVWPPKPAGAGVLAATARILLHRAAYLHLPAQEIVERRRRAAIVHRNHFYAGHAVEQCHVHMQRRADARRAEPLLRLLWPAAGPHRSPGSPGGSLTAPPVDALSAVALQGAPVLRGEEVAFVRASVPSH